MAELDDREFLKRIDLYDKKVVSAAKRAQHQNALWVEQKGKELAPKLTGALERDIVASPAMVERGGIVAEIHAGTGNSRAYAVYQHEVGSLAQGMITANKPGNEFGAAGPFYLRRPVVFGMDRMTKHIADSLRGIR